MPQPRKHSPQTRERFLRLLKAYGNLSKAAAELGVSRGTARRWVESEQREETLQPPRRDRSRTARRLDDIIRKSQERVLEALPRASAQQAATVFGIAIDKKAKMQVMGEISPETEPKMVYAGFEDDEEYLGKLRQLPKGSYAPPDALAGLSERLDRANDIHKQSTEQHRDEPGWVKRLVGLQKAPSKKQD